MVMYPNQVTVEDPMIPGVVTPVGNSAMPRQGWVDGARGSYLEFQSADLRWDDQLVIEEVPIYHFVARGDDGSLVQLPIPTVAGTGPPYSNTLPPITSNPPTPGPPFTSHYAGYWRLYTVVLPQDARVFAPPVRSEIAMALEPVFPLASNYSSEILQATVAQVGGVAGMVALNPDCFAGGLRRSRSHRRHRRLCRSVPLARFAEAHRGVSARGADPAHQRDRHVSVREFRGQAVVP